MHPQCCEEFYVDRGVEEERVLCKTHADEIAARGGAGTISAAVSAPSGSAGVPPVVTKLVSGPFGENGLPIPLAGRNCIAGAGPMSLAEDIDFALTLFHCCKIGWFAGDDKKEQKWQDVAATVASRNLAHPYRPGTDFSKRKLHFNKIVNVCFRRTCSQSIAHFVCLLTAPRESGTAPSFGTGGRDC